MQMLTGYNCNCSFNMHLLNFRNVILGLQILGLNIFIITTISAQILLDDEKEAIQTSCWNKTTCGDCIKTGYCIWCSQPRFDDNDKNPLPRCDMDTNLGGTSTCETEYIFRPQSGSNITIYKEIEKASGRLAATTITPQRMKVKLRVNDPIEFTVKIGEMEDYPLDLYFLMDLTATMKDDKEVLAAEGKALAEKMKKMTSKFRLGFGSFIDKVTLPFAQNHPNYFTALKKKCDELKTECIPPYAFKNHLILSNETDKFSVEVAEAKISASVDLPEGGFDALMQVMVCDKEIGWGKQARKLVVFATDDGFHIAGDGKLGGIVRPNDGLCHLNSDGEYTHSTELDYPSIAQLNSKMVEKSINVIFSVTADQTDIYKQLSSRLEGSRIIEMTANSSNIVDTVEDEYKKISQTIEITDNFTSPYFRVHYSSKCLNYTIEEDTPRCSNIKVGDVVEFKVKLELIKCPENRDDWNQAFKVYRSTVSDELLVELEMLCDCPCEQPGIGESSSTTCGGRGQLKCGMCECDKNHFGRYCECDYLHKNGTRIDNKSCRRSDSEEVCTGRGSCVCGECKCTPRENPLERYSGPFCECDNFSCDRINGELCSGHGSCTCGKCECYHGWSGTGCDCLTDVSTCRESDTSEICGGKNQGTCECGKCKCKDPYSGEFCEKCKHESCPTKCDDLKHCVQCKLFNTGFYDNPADCDLHCWRYGGLKPEEIVDILQESDDLDSDEVICREKDAIDNCTFYFLYNHDRSTDKYAIQAQREKECPPELPIFWIVTGIIALIVIIGVLTAMIWQLYEYLQTKREYSKFNTETQKVLWGTGGNALYRDPLTSFNNPTYGGTQDQRGFATGETSQNNENRRRALALKESNVDE